MAAAKTKNASCTAAADAFCSIRPQPKKMKARGASMITQRRGEV